MSAAAIAVLLAIGYEPMIALTGGTPGKRLLRIYAISVWDCTALNRADTLRRALFADLQLLFPPIIVYWSHNRWKAPLSQLRGARTRTPVALNRHAVGVRVLSKTTSTK